MKPKTRNEKGIFLISSFLIISVIGTFSVAIFSKSISTYRTTEHMRNRIAAFHLAESGLDLAITQLRHNSSYAGQGYTSFGTAGGYDVQVQTPDPVASPNIRRITARGYTPDNRTSSYAYERRQVVAYANVLSSPFNDALFAQTSIQMSGKAVVDSYDSRTGVVGTNGDIGTNGTTAGTISLSGNADVKGDAVVGPGADVSTAITTTDKAVIEGTQSSASSTTTLNAVQIPSDLTNLGALSISGKSTVTQAGGSYWYSSIDISGDGALSFSGPTTLYVTGSVSITGKGFVTAQDLPPNLLIYVQGSSNVNLSGKGDFYGAIYAPSSDVKISGDAALFGAVVGNTIKDSGKGRVRYDEALTTVQGNATGTASVLAWTEG